MKHKKTNKKFHRKTKNDDVIHNKKQINLIFRGESVDEVSFIISGSLEVIQDDEVGKI